MWDYTEKVKDHFYNPRNVGNIANPDGVGEEGSLACGDSLRLMFKLDENGRIKEAKFQTFGCGSAIASASALTEMIIGKTLEEAEKITNQDIAEYLGGLPPEKMHCSVMGREALEAAIANYRREDVETLRARKGQVVCECFGVTDNEIVRVIKENRLRSVEEVTNFTKAGGGCRRCHPQVEKLIAGVIGVEQKQEAAHPSLKKMSNIQKMKLIEEALEREIKPTLRADGGDLELIDIEGDRVVVALRGMCSSCPSSELTLKKYVESKLREFVSEDIIVEEAKP
ncbi:MAG: Fe-S cluster assembly protein NifU [Proteobacteria bacterium]|nr:Fe-S cluster assembly protein NifU [Pseudomonadota bacterium]